MYIKILFIVVLCLFFFTAFSTFSQVAAKDNNIRAKIGIQVKSGDSISRAKSQARLKSGDLLRIYVHSEDNCVVYIIHTDKKTVTLLNITEQQIQSSTLILPSAQSYYQIDGKSSMEKITIICSPYKLPELATIETDDISYAKWTSIQDDLIQKSRLILPQPNEKPFAIAGNVRGVADSITGDPFIKRLVIYSGKGLLVKTYEFKIKK